MQLRAKHNLQTSLRFTSILIVMSIFFSMVGCGIRITSPPDGSQYEPGAQIELKARRLIGASSAHDFEWSSSLDGDLGSGDALLTPDPSTGIGSLSAGEHTIKAEHPGLFIWHKWRDHINLTVSDVSCDTPDTSGLPILTYNEGLTTILRGIEIDSIASSRLGISPGYYRVREFRVSGSPSEKAKTLNIEKAYAEMFTGPSTLPKRDEEWVFSVIEVEEWTSERRKFKSYDFHGHTFEYELTMDSANNCWDTKASIDCIEVRLSTQTYTTGTLNTCNWESESPWTTP